MNIKYECFITSRKQMCEKVMCLSVHGVEGGGSPSSRVSVHEEGVAIHWGFPPKEGGIPSGWKLLIF